MLPASHVARRPAREDSAAVARVVNSCTRADVGMAAVTAHEVEAQWSARESDFEVVVSGDGEIVGYLETQIQDGLYFEGYVRPDHAGRGIGGHLVAAAERRAARLGGEDVVKVTSNVSNAAARRLMERNGYACAGHEYAMFMDLDQPLPPAHPPDGIELRGFVPGRDEHTLYEVMRESFGDDWSGPRELEPWIRSHLEHKAHDPSLWFFAVDDGEVAGAATCRSYWGAQEDVGWIKNLGVRPRWRRRGVGRALLVHAFELFRAAGRRKAVLGVDAANPTGAPSFYLAVGMRVGGESWDYAKLPGRVREPDPGVVGDPEGWIGRFPAAPSASWAATPRLGAHRKLRLPAGPRRRV
jgi:mycothiol synthase